MGLVNVLYKSNLISMAKTAHVNHLHVSWSSDIYVDYRLEHGNMKITHFSTGRFGKETVWSDSKLRKLNNEQREIIIAAALAIRVTTFIFGDDVIVISEDTTVPLSDYKYGISGLRVDPSVSITYSTESKPKIEISLPKISRKRAKWLAVTVVTVAAAIGLSALLSDDQ